MNCPCCDKEMQEGGLVSNGMAISWLPMEEYNRNPVKRMFYRGYKNIGTTNVALRETKVPDAYFCANCNKVVGIFDVTSGT